MYELWVLVSGLKTNAEAQASLKIVCRIARLGYVHKIFRSLAAEIGKTYENNDYIKYFRSAQIKRMYTISEMHVSSLSVLILFHWELWL